MSAEDSPSLGELGRTLVLVRDELREFRNDVTKRFDALDETYFRKELAAALQASLEKDLASLHDRTKSLEDNQTWLVRTVIGFVVVTLIAGVFVARSQGF